MLDDEALGVSGPHRSADVVRGFEYSDSVPFFMKGVSCAESTDASTDDGDVLLDSLVVTCSW